MRRSRGASSGSEGTRMRRLAAWLILASMVRTPLARAESSSPLVLEMTKGSVVRHGRDATVTVRVRNTTADPVTLYVRRDLLTFEILGPGGEQTTCAPMDPLRHPARLGFTKVAPHRSVLLTTRLVELCPRWTFSRRGEYSVRASYAAERTGQSVGLHAFTGSLVADRPAVVHVQHDSRVFRNHVVTSSGQRAPSVPSTPPASPPKARASAPRR